jgi:5-methylcytosine-specific restriction endonuclease McrA
MPRSPNTRKPISKTLRFEVFKRDSFRCQYCDAEAPNVLLHIDHIKPVAGGGTNELTNLITSCMPCNLGKSDRPLTDQSAVKKARAQLDELQVRREQLELMMKWRESLRDLDQEAVERLADYWSKHTPGWSVSDHGKRNIKKWLQTFSVEHICGAMDASATQYLEFNSENKVTSESFSLAFDKVLGICRVNKASEREPDLKQLYYIRGILRNRIPGYFNDSMALRYLKNARSWEVEVEELSCMARGVKNWTGFTTGIGELILQKKHQSGEDGANAA